jgi:hypothetical protein
VSMSFQAHDLLDVYISKTIWRPDIDHLISSCSVSCRESAWDSWPQALPKAT